MKREEVHTCRDAVRRLSLCLGEMNRVLDMSVPVSSVSAQLKPWAISAHKALMSILSCLD